jgi:hypothetical protein
VVGIPRFGARLAEAAAHLPLVLRDAAGVDAAIGWLGGPDAAVIGAARARLRPLLRFMSWRCGFLLLMLLRLRFALLLTLTLLLVLCGGTPAPAPAVRQTVAPGAVWVAP